MTDTATTANLLHRGLPWRRITVLAAIITISVAALVWAILVTRPAPQPGVPSPDAGVLYSTPLARLATNGAAVAAIGTALLLLLLGSAGRDQFEAIAFRARAIGIAAGIVWITAATTTWWLQAAAVSEAGTRMTFVGLIEYARQVNSGSALLVTILAAAAFAAIAALRPHPYWPAGCLAFALIGLIAVPVTGHASQSSAVWLTTPAICLHVCAMSLWVGGLALITTLATGRRKALALVLPRFSTVAGLCIALVAASGVLLTGPRLIKDPTPGLYDLAQALIHTPAGWLVVGKLCGLFLLGTTGGYIRQILLPAVRREEPAALAILAAVELTVMAAVIALATVLARPL
ncbi:CopD family protein [Kribbella sp. NBC_01245]|uniref:copper resistance D family protein n=1 Tax=Kribbella sp. NBC_01245 TaxID=2903578 RepID=UPI002E2AD9E8|nr:CopD family protein [Kribbella sp. NBC_01245]